MIGTPTPEEVRRRTRRSLAEDFADGVIPWGPDTTVTRDVAVAAVADLQAAVDQARRPGQPTPRDLQTRILRTHSLIHETLPEIDDALQSDLKRLYDPIIEETIAEIYARQAARQAVDQAGVLAVSGWPAVGHQLWLVRMQLGAQSLPGDPRRAAKHLLDQAEAEAASASPDKRRFAGHIEALIEVLRPTRTLLVPGTEAAAPLHALVIWLDLPGAKDPATS
jgi:hypothetical protein